MRTIIHPGEVLADALDSHGKSAEDVVAETSLKAQCVHNILAGEHDINQGNAEELARFFDVSPGLWLKAQALHDRERAAENLPAKPCGHCVA